MLTTLWAVVAVLATLLALNLLVTTAILRRLRHGDAGSDEIAAALPRPGTVLSSFTAVDADGRGFSTSDVDDRVVLLLSPTCRACDDAADDLLRRRDDVLASRVLVVVMIEDDQVGARQLAQRLDAEFEVRLVGEDAARDLRVAVGGVRATPAVIRVRAGVVERADIRLEPVLAADAAR